MGKKTKKRKGKGKENSTQSLDTQIKAINEIITELVIQNSDKTAQIKELQTKITNLEDAFSSWIKGQPPRIVQMEPSKSTKDSNSVEEKSKKTEKKVNMNIEMPESEEEDESMDVEEIEIDGKSYYKTDYGKLFDPETSECVGKYVNGKIVKSK